jgi:hypothetical protein
MADGPHSTDVGDLEPDVMTHVMPFSGTPRLYLRTSIAMSVGIHLWLYLGMLFFHGYLGGAEWVFGWKPAAAALVACVLFARFAYQWIMRLDAQYGSGSGWALPRRVVKLPEPRPRRRPQG